MSRTTAKQERLAAVPVFAACSPAELALVERLREVGERVQRPPGQVAVAWTLRNPAVTGAIVGSRNAKQVEANVDAATLRLTNKEIAEIEGKNVYEPELVIAA